MSFTETFSAWFNRELKRRKWSQADFHRRSGVPRSTVSTWATGERHPDPGSVDLIADTFGFDPAHVMNVLGHLPRTDDLPADDPRNDLIGMIKRIEDWPPLSFDAIHNQLESILTWQKAQRKGKR